MDNPMIATKKHYVATGGVFIEHDKPGGNCASRKSRNI